MRGSNLDGTVEVNRNVFLLLTILHDANFTECEVSVIILAPEPDHHIASSLIAALTLKFLLALERFLLMGADLLVCKVGGWRVVRDSDVKIVQTFVCGKD